jgi:hypothetical protein
MSEVSTKRREALFSKLLDKEITVNQARKFNLKDWNKAFGSKIKTENSLKAQKRLLNQVENRIDEIIDYHKQKIQDLEKLKLPEKDLPKVKDLVFPSKKGQYGIVLITDNKNQNKFWIKYRSKQHYNKQINNLLLDSLNQDFSIDFQSIGTYKEFVDSQFLKELGIEL